MASKRSWLRVVAAFLLSIACWVAVSAQRPSKTARISTSPLPIVKQIGDAELKGLVRPNGRPLLINFWATWCVPCREEFPDLVLLDKEFRGKIDFITISLDDLAEIDRDVPKFLAAARASMPAYLLKTADENAAIAVVTDQWKGGLPFSILYEPGGGTAYFRQGKINIATVRQKINGLLAVKQP